MNESSELTTKEDTDGRRAYMENWRRRLTETYEEGSFKECCSVLRHSLAVMLTGVTWQLGIVILVLVELIISLVLMLIEFQVIKDETHLARLILHPVGLTILAIFVFEVLLKFYAMGCEYFLTDKLELFDAFVVISAFAIEILFSVMRAKKAWKGFAFIIVLRLWRVFRLVVLLFAFKEELYELIEDTEDGPKPDQQEKTKEDQTMEETDEKSMQVRGE